MLKSIQIFRRSCLPDFVGLLVIYGITSKTQLDVQDNLDILYSFRNQNIKDIIPNETCDKEIKVINSKPIALGLVELLDQDEHCLKLIWVDDQFDRLDPNLSRMVTLRTIAHAFDYIYPKPHNAGSRSRNNNSSRNRQKHISFLESHGKLYPKSVYYFLTDISIDSSLKFGMHYETLEDGGSHEDYASTSIQCKCYKFADKPNAFMFWGISESRLKNVWNLNRSKIVPTTTPNEEVVKLACDISMRHVTLVNELSMA